MRPRGWNAGIRLTAMAGALALAACNGAGLPQGLGAQQPLPALPVQTAAPPRYADPLEGLHRGRAADAPENAAVRSGERPALVVSGNTGQTLSYLEVTRSLLVNARASGAEEDPAYPIAAAMTVLKARLPALQPFPHLQAAYKGKASLTLVLDLQAVKAQGVGPLARGNSLRIEVVAFDAGMAPVSRFSALGRNDGGPQDFNAAADMALAEFQAKAEALLQPGRQGDGR